MENFVKSVWENVLEDPSTDEIDPGLFMIPFSKISNQLLLFSVFLFSVSRFILFRRIAISDVASLLTIRKSVFFNAKQQNWCLVFALKTKTTTKQTKYSTICGAWYNLHNNNWYSKISLHGFQNLWKKCAIFLFNKPSHLIENWW